MKCFVHSGQEAVGTCRTCHRGLCRDCAVAEPGFIACHGACAEQARRLEALVANNVQSYRTARGNWWLMPAFFALFAAIFLYFGFQRFDDHVNIATTMGIAFIVFAGVLLFRNLRWARTLR